MKTRKVSGDFGGIYWYSQFTIVKNTHVCQLMRLAIHCALLFLEMINLNVALNSEISSFLTIVLGNNMTELKITVFKKQDERGMQNILYFDAVERTQKAIALFLIYLHPKSVADDFLFKIFVLIIAEFLIDWIKHVFLTKMNDLQADIFGRFYNGLKELSFACRFVDTTNEFEPIRKATSLDIKEQVIVEGKLPHSGFKLAIRIHFVLLPHVVLIAKQAIPHFNRVPSLRQDLPQILTIVAVLVAMKIFCSMYLYSIQKDCTLVHQLQNPSDPVIDEIK